MTRRLLALAILFLLTAGTATAVETVLTSDSTLYTIDSEAARPLLELTKRVGTERESIVVPASADPAFEDSDARLAWDTASETLYVVWHRRGEDSDEIVLSSMSKGGQWSEAVVVASDGGARHEGLQIALHRAKAEGEEATLIHAVWWSLSAGDPKAEYALVAFSAGSPVSIERTSLEELSAMHQSGGGVEVEDTGEAVHPPLAIERSGNGVEIVFGGPKTTTLSRVRVTPVLRAIGEARMWKPLGRSGGHVPSARLTSVTPDPVKAFMIGGRIVLYTPDSAFRYVVFDDGEWSPARMITLDENLTCDRMLHELRRAIEAHSDPDVAPQE